MSSGKTWQQILRTNFTRWEALADFWELDQTQRLQISPHPKFILNLPRRLAEKAAKGTLDDPIVRQFLPLVEETHRSPNFIADPVADASFRKTQRFLQKYQGRILLLPSSACAMHCRYCFRQNYAYDVESAKTFQDEMALIAQDPTIREVILSGGDPLSLPNAVLRSLLQQLAAISHLSKIRFHSRFLMGIPERIDAEFLQLIAEHPQQIWFVIHANHVQEFDTDIWQALRQLRAAGATVLNQSVLLKGVNDSFEALHDLCTALSDHGVLPYYLHQLDRVQGTTHFEVLEEKGEQLIQQLRHSLPGYAVPRYVKEVPHAPSKTPL